MSMRYLSLSQLSEVTGKDRRTVSKRLAGVKPHSNDGRAIIYDSHEVLELLFAPESSVGMQKQLEKATLGLEQAKQAKLEIEVGKLKGELIPIEEVAKTVEKEYAYIRAQFRSIPSKLAKPLSMVTDPNRVHSDLHEAVDECLRELVADTYYREQLETVNLSSQDTTTTPQVLEEEQGQNVND